MAIFIKKTESNLKDSLTIKSLKEIIDQQNKELSNLRWVATHLEDYARKQKELEKTIEEHQKLCAEAKEEIKKCKKLNKELSFQLNLCKQGLEKIQSLDKKG